MQKHTSTRRLTAAATLTTICLGILYRLLRIAYSTVYADVAFADSFVAFMYYACAVMEGIMWSSITCCAAYFSLKCERKGALCLVPASAGLLASYGIGLAYDLVTVSVKGVELLALANTVLRTALGTLLCFVAFLFSRRRVRKGVVSTSALIVPASAVLLAASLISRTAELIRALIANSFSITGAEILSLASEYLEIFLLQGVLVFTAARLFWEIFDKFGGSKPISDGE